MFFASFPQGPGCLSYVFLIACYVGTLVAVDDSTLLILGAWSLGFISTCLVVVFPLEVYLDTILTTYVFKAFGCALCVWDDYLSYEVFVTCCMG